MCIRDRVKSIGHRRQTKIVVLQIFKISHVLGKDCRGTSIGRKYPILSLVIRQITYGRGRLVGDMLVEDQEKILKSSGCRKSYSKTNRENQITSQYDIPPISG